MTPSDSNDNATEPNGSYRDPDLEGAIAALRRAGRKVHEESKRTGTPIVIWEDGQIKEVIGTPEVYDE